MSLSDAKSLAEKIRSFMSIKLNRNGEPSYSSRALPDGRDFWIAVKRNAPLTFSTDLPRDTYIRLEMEPAFCSEIRLEIKKVIQAESDAEKEKERAAFNSGAIYFNDSIPCPLSRLLVIENVMEDSGSALYDPDTDVSYPYAFKVIERTLLRKLGEEILGEWYSTNLRQAIFSYRPHKGRLFKEDKHWVFNGWNKPEWMIGWVPDPTVTALPEETETFIKHLAPNEFDRNHLLAWLKDAVFSRAEPILILRGDPGCGKNLFLEHLGAALVGSTGSSLNYSKATRKFTQSSFHAYMARSCLFVLDEFELTDTLKQTLKDYANGIAVLEEKNKRVSTPITLSCSFSLVANKKDQIKLEVDDRKFFVPTLNTQDLLLVQSRDWVDNLARVLWLDVDYQRHIASYLKFKVKHIKNFPIKTPQFMELCWLTHPAYLQAFMSMAVARKEFVAKDMPSKRGPQVQFERLREMVHSFGVAHKIKRGVGVFTLLDNGWSFVSNVVGRTDLTFLNQRDDVVTFKEVAL